MQLSFNDKPKVLKSFAFVYNIRTLYWKDQIYVSLATVCGSEYISSKDFEMSKSEISFFDILGNLALAVINSL